MKKKPDLHQLHDHDRHLEILKAVAQAWHNHTGTSKPASEFDAHRRNSRPTPSRFKLEAIRSRTNSVSNRRWDFAQSLWDSYEIVTVSKKLEAGLVLDGDGFREAESGGGRSQRKRRESCNSLRNLFNRASSRRFNY
ncbi:uncharacterized protein E5676_scaffold248G003950 [Cucumis melo var. makuwa]|uniref:Uncharacterized protein n=2 Tax=Cucumis melo TaxID=3656 RepID=A0A5A7UNW1_CUCMM|nr:uncharacterized protein E6C27_scaffold80G001040 [Cucumis melo var. makuwa]TYJ99185.1 uncharacterized protein E5676_scaffold248G003950 [Cucumis melo var. makuwa]